MRPASCACSISAPLPGRLHDRRRLRRRRVLRAGVRRPRRGNGYPAAAGPGVHSRPCRRAERASGCPTSAGTRTPTPTTACRSCEFQPPTGSLNTAVKWQWGLIDATEFPTIKDVWATPTVARLYDANCDGRIDVNDPPNVVFVAGHTTETCCSCSTPLHVQTGVLRMLDGSTGEEIWSLDKPQDSSPGSRGCRSRSAISRGSARRHRGDERRRHPVLIDRNGQVVAIADQPAADGSAGAFGWGGGCRSGTWTATARRRSRTAGPCFRPPAGRSPGCGRRGRQRRRGDPGDLVHGRSRRRRRPGAARRATRRTTSMARFCGSAAT